MSKQLIPFILFPADTDGIRFIQLNNDHSLRLFSTAHPDQRLTLDKVKDEVLAKVGLFYQENFDQMASLPGFTIMIKKLGEHYEAAADAASGKSAMALEKENILDFIESLLMANRKGQSKGLFDLAKQAQMTGEEPATTGNGEPTVTERAIRQDETALRAKYNVLVTPIPEHKYRKCLVRYFVNKEFDYDPYGNANAVIKLPNSAIEWTVRHSCHIRSWNVTPEVEGMSVMKTVRLDDIGQVINYIMVNTTM